MSKEFGFYTKDEDGVMLLAHSNSGKDQKIYMDNAKEMKRPILLEIQGEIFDKYQFSNFALTPDEARNLIREMSRMLDYLEE